jgi:protein SCO1/2
MTKFIHLYLALAALALASLSLPGAASAQPSNPSGPLPKEVGIEPRLGERAPLDAELTDESGAPRRLGDFFKGKKPVILALAYYECPMLCSMVLNGLTAALRANSLTPGEDFEVVIVSIDPTDTKERAQAKKATMMRAYDRPGTEGAFHFMTASEAESRRVADAVGFKYAYDPIGKQYAHGAGIVLLTGDGTISRYLYGVDFAPRDIRLGLVEAASGAIGGVGDKLMLLCFRYDPARGKYGAFALTSVRAGGVLTLVVLGISLVVMNRRSRRDAARAGKEES